MTSAWETKDFVKLLFNLSETSPNGTPCYGFSDVFDTAFDKNENPSPIHAGVIGNFCDNCPLESRKICRQIAENGKSTGIYDGARYRAGKRRTPFYPMMYSDIVSRLSAISDSLCLIEPLVNIINRNIPGYSRIIGHYTFDTLTQCILVDESEDKRRALTSLLSATRPLRPTCYHLNCVNILHLEKGRS